VRILHVNKFLYRRGGAEAYMLDLAELQRAAGHQVEFFAMRHPDNLPATFADMFPSHVEFETPPPTLGAKARAAGRLLWSPSAARGMADVLRTFRPDVVHLHNIYHQLSPSILRSARRAGAPVVMTLHDYKLVCPTYRLLDRRGICEACIPHRFWNPTLRRCNRGSLTASTLNGVEMTLHTVVGAYDPVHRFICPSRFLEGKMRAGRVDPHRLRWVPNYVDAAAISPKTTPGGDVVSVGRLSDEKGVDVLIEALARAPGLRADILGDGPARPELERLAAALRVQDRVTFHGRVSANDVYEGLRAASVVAVPSRWYENMPITVLEAFAAGVPVVASDLGGLPELIDDGGDGFLVPPDEPGILAEALTSLAADPPRAFEMGRAARTKVVDRHAPGSHLERIDAVYAEARDEVRGWAEAG
jgi:glycosyltransferase involved in cell wall biosynthesis